VDRSRFFVGSFNFDPRSRKLNTELGFVIDSPDLAQEIEAAFHDGIPANSYELHLSNTGALYWTEHRGDELMRYNHEPGSAPQFGSWPGYQSSGSCDGLVSNRRSWAESSCRQISSARSSYERSRAA
jgi:phosphatidylserine/phosphatidylglycerophosphate/cardiolipin synthase-like enzyme